MGQDDAGAEAEAEEEIIKKRLRAGESLLKPPRKEVPAKSMRDKAGLTVPIRRALHPFGGHRCPLFACDR